jgi:hypothetical protein
MTVPEIMPARLAYQAQCLLSRPQRTSLRASGLSALCQKRTSMSRARAYFFCPCPTTGIGKTWRLCQKQGVNSAFCFENRFLLIVALNLASPKNRQFRTPWMNPDQP